MTQKPVSFDHQSEKGKCKYTRDIEDISPIGDTRMLGRMQKSFGTLD
jgi:hypothetical protein